MWPYEENGRSTPATPPPATSSGTTASSGTISRSTNLTAAQLQQLAAARGQVKQLREGQMSGGGVQQARWQVGKLQTDNIQRVEVSPVEVAVGRGFSIDLTGSPFINYKRSEAVSASSARDLTPPIKSKKDVPSIVQFVPLSGGKEKKLGVMISEAGREYLTKKMSNAAEDDNEGYNKAEHLDMLNQMYPETLAYSPVTLSNRIKSYLTFARNAVKDSERTGQGQYDYDLYAQDESPEEEILRLINQANSLSKPSNKASKEKSFSLAGTEFEALEEQASCMNCNKSEASQGKLHSTAVGDMCSPCLEGQNQQQVGTTSRDLHTTGSDQDLQEEANITQNRELHLMKLTKDKKRYNPEEEQDKKMRRKKPRTSASDEENDNFEKMLMSQLSGINRDRERREEKEEREERRIKEKQELDMEVARGKKEKQKMEMEALRLDIELKKKNLNQ